MKSNFSNSSFCNIIKCNGEFVLCGIKFGIAAFVDMPFPDYIWEWNSLVRTMLSFEKLRELSYYKFQDYQLIYCHRHMQNSISRVFYQIFHQMTDFFFWKGISDKCLYLKFQTRYVSKIEHTFMMHLGSLQR